MGFLSKIFGSVPILGNVAKGIDNTLGRPGDLINNPGQFLGNAIQGASPFLMGPLGSALGTSMQMPAWASTLMGMGQGGGGANSWLNSAAGLYNLSGIGQPRYPDNGMGDRALGYADQMGLAGTSMLNNAMQNFSDPVEARRRDPNSGTMDYLNSAGMDFLRQGNTMPSINNPGQMGALSYMPGLMSQMANQAGVANPFIGQGGSQDPYALRPHEQSYFNTQGNMAAQGEQAALGRLRQQMASKGMTDPRYRAIAEANIRAGRTNNLMDTHAGLSNQAFQNRQQTNSQFSQMMPQLYQMQNQRQQQSIGQGMNFLDYSNRLGQQGRDDIYRRMGIGQSFLNAPMNAYENAAQRAIGTNRDAGVERGQNVASLLSPFMGQSNPWMDLFRPQRQQQGNQTAMPPWDLTGAQQPQPSGYGSYYGQGQPNHPLFQLGGLY